jgi:LacI family transcriptional regulator
LVDDERYVAHNIRTVEGAYEATRRLLALESPPTAIFAGQNLLTMGALRAIREVGLHHTIALVGFDDFMLADLMEPAVTVVAQNPTVIGREAATLLFRRLDGDVSPYVVIDVPTNLLVRGSGEILAPSH